MNMMYRNLWREELVMSCFLEFAGESFSRELEVGRQGWWERWERGGVIRGGWGWGGGEEFYV